ncbi:MAG TPA: hypothetical protein VNN10_06635 [Dehalococcoidia bacterium]|nr:hypothetical protein [Dehalococcoidia bacterium]
MTGRETSRPQVLVPWASASVALGAVLAVLLLAPDGHTVWYFVRASGISAYGLLTLTVVGGLVVSNRTLPGGQARADVFDAHQFLALLSLGTSGLHALALLLDEYVGFSPRQVLLPFTSSYRPVAVALGIMALYLLAAVYASFYLRRWIGQKAWRAVHYASFAVFVLATYHGILSGADSREIWVLALYLGAIFSVVGLTAWRLVREAPTVPAKQAAASITATEAPESAWARGAAAAQTPSASTRS